MVRAVLIMDCSQHSAYIVKRAECKRYDEYWLHGECHEKFKECHTSDYYNSKKGTVRHCVQWQHKHTNEQCIHTDKAHLFRASAEEYYRERYKRQYKTRRKKQVDSVFTNTQERQT